MGPKLRDADVPQRFEFDDVDMVVNIRAATDDEDGNLYWEWNDDVDWKPKVKMKMSSAVANKYFQGKENVAVAIARRRIKTSGDVKGLGACADPDHEARLRAVPRGRRGRVSAPEGLSLDPPRIVDESLSWARPRVDRRRTPRVASFGSRRSALVRDPRLDSSARIGGCSYVNEKRLEGVLQWIVIARQAWPSVVTASGRWRDAAVAGAGRCGERGSA